MKHSMRARELTMELMVGTFLFVVLLMLSFFTIVLSRENFFKKSYPLVVVFEDVMGLREGDNVTIRGMPVGKVKSLSLYADGVHVLAETERELQLRSDYRIQVISTSVLGGRYLQVFEGSALAPRLPAGATLRGLRPYDLMAEASEIVARARKSIEETRLFENVGAAVSNLTAITERINRGEGSLGQLINNEALYADAAETMREIKVAVSEKQLFARIEAAAANLEEISAKIVRGEGTVGKLINDDTLYVDAADIVADLKTAIRERNLLANVEASVANLKEISDKIARGEGSIGRMVNDDDLYVQMQHAMEEVRSALNDIRETTPIATFSSIVLGAF